MNQIAVAKYIADGGAVYLPFGYIPDYFLMLDFGADTASVFYHWFKMMEEIEATGYQEGLAVSEGVTDTLADDGGMTAYNTSSDQPTVSAWAASTSATARSASGAGTYVHATISNTQGMDVNAIFECVTAGTTGSSEPTWPKEIGGQTASDNGVIWERVDQDAVITRGGYQGVALAAGIQTDGHLMYCLAIQADQSWNWGDVDGWTSGVAPSSTLKWL